MEQAARCLEKAERYEVLGEVYKMVIPIYERAREYEVKLVSITIEIITMPNQWRSTVPVSYSSTAKPV